jgi:hypothetical protein
LRLIEWQCRNQGALPVILVMIPSIICGMFLIRRIL